MKELDLKSILKSTPTLVKKPFEKLKIFIHGPAGVGKSTLFSKFDNHLFLNTDQGLDFLKVRKIPIESWKTFKTIANDLIKNHGRKEYNNLFIVIDLIEGLYLLCRKYVLALHGLSHESDAGYGKGHDLVKMEFRTIISSLAVLYGMGFISHSREVTIKSRLSEITKIQTMLPTEISKFIEGLCDYVGYCEFSLTKEEKKLGKRYITFNGNENLLAKTRSNEKDSFPDKMSLDLDVIKKCYDANIENLMGRGGGLHKKNKKVKKLKFKK